MKRFRVEGWFEAEDIDDALWWLAQNFASAANGHDDPDYDPPLRDSRSAPCSRPRPA